MLLSFSPLLCHRSNLHSSLSNPSTETHMRNTAALTNLIPFLPHRDCTFQLVRYIGYVCKYDMSSLCGAQGYGVLLAGSHVVGREGAYAVKEMHVMDHCS